MTPSSGQSSNAAAPSQTRDRIITAANELFRRQGFNGTSMKQVVEASGATTGSVYHFFPGGKDELTAEALRVSGQAYADLVDMTIRAGANPAAGMRDAFEGAATVLIESDFIDPCPIGTVAREVASTHEPLRQAAANVMSNWGAMLSAIFVEAGIAPATAESLETVTVASIEGGFIMARTHRDTAPFLAIGRQLSAMIEAELP